MNEFLRDFRELKVKYDGLLTPFFNRIEIRHWKNEIYTSDLSNFEKNVVWEYLNGDIDIRLLTERDYMILSECETKIIRR